MTAKPTSPVADAPRPAGTKKEGCVTNLSDKLGLTIPEAAAISSLGQTSIYKAIKEGRLKSRKYGSRTIIMRADLTAFMENLPSARAA